VFCEIFSSEGNCVQNASADFQNLCRLASKKGAESAVFFCLEGTLLHNNWRDGTRMQQSQQKLAEKIAEKRR